MEKKNYEEMECMEYKVKKWVKDEGKVIGR